MNLGRTLPDHGMPNACTGLPCFPFHQLFHQEQPVDFLLRYHLAILGFKVHFMKRGCPLALLPLRSCSPRSHGESSCSTALGECSAPRIPLMVPCRLTTATLRLLLRFDHRRPQKPKLRMPTLFEHKGVVSSLKGKTQTVQDQLLPQEGAKKQLHGDNPPATVESTMSAYGNHIPSNAYLRAPGQFWAQNPKEGATFTVRFNVPQDVQRVVRLYAPALWYCVRTSIVLRTATFATAV